MANGWKRGSHADAWVVWGWGEGAFQAEGGASTGAPQWAPTSQFQELQAASEAGGNGQARTAAKLRADTNGRAVCADHAVLFRLFTSAWAFTRHEGPLEGLTGGCPDLTRVLAFH